MNCGSTKCKCPCHHSAGLFIILIGVVFLLKNFGIFSEDIVSKSWPILLIVLGLSKFCKSYCKCCNKKHEMTGDKKGHEGCDHKHSHD